MNKADYESVVKSLRLADGTLFPMPITLDVTYDQVKLLNLRNGTRVTLRDFRDEKALAILTGKFLELLEFDLMYS